MKENKFEINNIPNSSKIKIAEMHNNLKFNNSNVLILENNKKPITFRLRHFPFFYCINNIRINYFVSSLVILIAVVIIFLVCFLIFRKGINSNNNITNVTKNEYIINNDNYKNQTDNNNIKSEFSDKNNEIENEVVSDTIKSSDKIVDNINNSCYDESIEYEVNNSFNYNQLNQVYHIKVENGYTYCTIYIYFRSSTKYRYYFNYEVRSICSVVFIYITIKVEIDLDIIDHATFQQIINKGIQFIFKKTPKNIQVIENGHLSKHYIKIDNI